MTGVRGRVLLPALLAGFVAMQFMSVAAQAEQQGEDRQRGWFFEMGIGQIKDRNDLATGVETGGAPYMKRAYLGYAISRFFGVEAGVLESSRIEYGNAGAGSASLGTLGAKGIHGKVFLTVPFQRNPDGFYGVTFTGGGWRWDGDFSPASGGSSFHETGVAPTASVGLVFAGRTAAVKLEYERFFLKTDNQAPFATKTKLTYDAVSVNLQFFF
jgi:hypothetical protein